MGGRSGNGSHSSGFCAATQPSAILKGSCGRIPLLSANKPKTVRHSMRLTLSAEPPFAFKAVVGSHGWAQLAPFQRTADDSSLRYVMQLSSERVVGLDMQEIPGGVSVDVDAPLDEKEQAEVADHVDVDAGTRPELCRILQSGQQ